MDDLIEALQILRKYGNPQNPTHCEHDELYVYPGVDNDAISDEDKKRLSELSFNPCHDDDGFCSFRFGSC